MEGAALGSRSHQQGLQRPVDLAVVTGSLL